MELTEKQLNEVLAGNINGINKDKIFENKDLYRKKQIEELKEQKEIYEQIKNIDKKKGK